MRKENQKKKLSLKTACMKRKKNTNVRIKKNVAEPKKKRKPHKAEIKKLYSEKKILLKHGNCNK